MREPRDESQHAAVVQIMREAADRHAVPRRVALAFAWVESKHNPDCEGDLAWHQRDGGERYRRLVLQNPRFRNNPARLVPEAWHSYGLFQLLACYHVRFDEHPRVLLDAELNAERACVYLARLLEATHGDPLRARLLYVGGSRLPSEKQTPIFERLHAALQRFHHE